MLSSSAMTITVTNVDDNIPTSLLVRMANTLVEWPYPDANGDKILLLGFWPGLVSDVVASIEGVGSEVSVWHLKPGVSAEQVIEKYMPTGAFEYIEPYLIDAAVPQITSGGFTTFDENKVGVVYQAAAQGYGDAALTWTLGGKDADLFSINSSTGEVSLKNPLNAESYNYSPRMYMDLSWTEYQFTVTANDGINPEATRHVTLVVKNLDEAPLITSPTTVTFAENGLDVAYMAQVLDPDYNAFKVSNPLQFGLSGADADLFTIDTFGQVKFKNAPDFEMPADADGDNVYDVNIKVSDVLWDYKQDIFYTGLSSELPVHIKVTNVEDSGSGNIVLLGNPVYGTSGNDTFLGTSGIDYIYGFAGDDVFHNSAGLDVLTGGAGRDTFNFKLGYVEADGVASLGFDPKNIDTITDFVSGEDTIGFAGLFMQSSPVLRLSDDMLVQGSGAVALDANDWFIFDTNNGKLYFDMDGNGAQAPMHFATLLNVTSLAASDIATYASDVIL